jgi:hypothetical protein
LHDRGNAALLDTVIRLFSLPDRTFIRAAPPALAAASGIEQQKPNRNIKLFECASFVNRI